MGEGKIKWGNSPKGKRFDSHLSPFLGSQKDLPLIHVKANEKKART